MKRWMKRVAVVFGVLATAAAAQGAGAGDPFSPGADAMQSSSQLAAIRAADALKSQSQAIERLVEDHRTLVARRPSSPPVGADASAQQAHDTALAAWTTRLDRLEERMRAGLSRLDVAQQRLDSLTAADHPASLLRDVEAARKAAADARSNARRALATPQAS